MNIRQKDKMKVNLRMIKVGGEGKGGCQSDPRVMKKIVELSKQNPVNYYQLVRWVSNKEKHADEIQHIVTQYFMTQRIKPDAKKYSDKLAVLHKMLIYAMKCKQSTDVAHVSTLRSLTKEFEILYFGHSHK
jgi:nickel superoxide dismutase